MITLQEYQTNFKNAVVTNETDDPLGTQKPVTILKFKSTRNFSIEERLGVYRYAYLARLQESLSDDCSRVIKKLSELNKNELNKNEMNNCDTTWEILSENYLRDIPPHTYTLYDLADRLPHYIRITLSETAFAQELAELAEMDFIALISSVQPTAKPLSQSDLNKMIESSTEEITISLQESVRFWNPQEGAFHSKPRLFINTSACTIDTSEISEIELSSDEFQILENLKEPLLFDLVLEKIAFVLNDETEVFSFFKKFSSLGVFKIKMLTRKANS